MAKRYVHLYSLTFPVDSDSDDHCTFEEFMAGLQKQMANVGEMEYMWDEEKPESVFEI